MRKDYCAEDIAMFERNAGLLVKVKDITAALGDCAPMPSEELVNALRHFQEVTVLYQQICTCKLFRSRRVCLTKR